MSKVYINMTICGLVSATALAAFMGQVEQDGPRSISDAEPEAPVEETKTKKRAAVDKPKPEPAAEEQQEDAGETNDVPTKEDLEKVFKKFLAAQGREAMAELLEEYGAKNLSAIPEDKRQEAMDKANAKLEG